MLRSHTQTLLRPVAAARREDQRALPSCTILASVIWLTAITHALGVLVAEEIDAVKRSQGQVKGLAYSGQAPTVREQIFEMHALGFGPYRIARETRLSRKQIARVLTSEGIRRQPSVPASSFLPQILELAEIGQVLGYSRKAICRALKRAGNPESS